MKRTLKRVAPIRLGITLAVLYALFAILLIPFFFLPVIFTNSPESAVAGVGMTVFLGLLYPAMGFITGVIGAAAYNLVVPWTGGIEVEVE